MAEAAEGLELSGDASLKKILNNTISTIEDNKAQLFDIYESVRTEVEAAKKQLEDLKFQVRQTIERVDALTKQEQQEKQKLALASRNFAKEADSEARMKERYDAVKNVQVALAVERDKEKRLRDQRDKLEIRLRHLMVMLQQAEHLALAIGSVLNYLSTQVTGVVWQIEAVQKDKLVGARIIKAVEEERYRMSRELHDGPAQDLANLMFSTSIVEKLIDFNPDEAKKNLQEMRQQIRDCLSSVRQVIFDMRPMALDDIGLEAAIHQLIAKLGARGVLAAEYQLDGTPVRLSKYVEVAAFRIVQEALNNVAHHSGVKTARVRVLYTKAALSILIEDEGKGFDPDEFEARQKEEAESQDVEAAVEAELEAADDGSADSGNHFGLVSMKERAKMVGAELNVTSAPGKGTRVHLRIPYKKEDVATPQDGDAKGRKAKR